MKKDNRDKKEKVIMFSEEIDGNIGGAAVGMAFIVVAIFVVFNKTYLVNETVTAVARWLFLLFGTPIAFACLLHKAKCNSNRLAFGIFVCGIWLLLYLYVDFLWTRILGLLFLFIASFLILQELFFLTYSLAARKKKEDNDRSKSIERTNSSFAFIATILGLILVAIQMLQQLGVI